MSARSRTLRAGTPITIDDLAETKVDVTLDTDVYKAIGVTDEEMTLDIDDFGVQVLNPMVSAVARGVEDKLAATIVAAPFATTIEVDNTDPFVSILDARAALNKANVPAMGRTLLIGADLERKLLGSTRFTAQISGDTVAESALRDATVGANIAGFRVVTSNAIDPDEGVAFHQTAFALATRAPVVPDGATWGQSTSFAGLAMRVLKDYDFLNVRDRVLADLFIGSDYVPDYGAIDSEGRFTPDPLGSGSALTGVTGVAATDIITTTAHGYVAGQAIRFSALTGGSGLSTGTTYYVLSSNLAANTYQVSATPGGSAVNFTTDITAGTVAKAGTLIRAVRLVDNA